MSLDVYFQPDAKTTLTALHTANRATILRLSESPLPGGGTRDDRHLNWYAAGYPDALCAEEVAFGVRCFFDHVPSVELTCANQIKEGRSNHD